MTNYNHDMDRTLEDLRYFIISALDGMAAILTDLSDDLANRSPDLPGANSPFVILTHCLGVVEFWAGHVVAGRESHRDRDSEFRAYGQIADLVSRTEAAKVRFSKDLEGVDLKSQVVNVPRSFDSPHADLTNGGALFHVLGEVAQHHGQMEITRDMLNRGS